MKESVLTEVWARLRKQVRDGEAIRDHQERGEPSILQTCLFLEVSQGNMIQVSKFTEQKKFCLS